MDASFITFPKSTIYEACTLKKYEYNMNIRGMKQLSKDRENSINKGRTNRGRK